jgi:hypothetical protein
MTPVHAVSGKASFFDMPTVGDITEITGDGAEVFILEQPERRVSVDAEGHFRFDGLEEGSRVTFGLKDPRFYPTLTATLRIGEGDVEDLTFQIVTWRIAELVGLTLGADVHDPERCHMVTTVAAVTDHRWDIFAPGEPDAVVSVEPAPVGSKGITYYNAQTIPAVGLRATTTDGGAMVAGARPGTYWWTAKKPERVFNRIELQCVAGFMTNASPPWGLQAEVP